MGWQWCAFVLKRKKRKVGRNLAVMPYVFYANSRFPNIYLCYLYIAGDNNEPRGEKE